MSKKNKARVNGEGNIIIQDVTGSTINIGRGSDPETLAKLEELQAKGLELGEGITDIQDLVEQSIELILKRLPKQITKEDIPALLRLGSKKYHSELISAEGRFGHLGRKIKLKQSVSGDSSSENILTQPEQFEPLVSLSEDILTQPKGQGVKEALRQIWDEKKGRARNALLIGESGMGKTANLVWLWSSFLAQQVDGQPIPIYLALSEYNNTVDKQRFILRQLLRHYLGEKRGNSPLEDALWKWLEQKWSQPYPKLLLLLDGWDEISLEKSTLLQEFNEEWLKKASGVQLLISAREDLKNAVSAFSEFKTLELQALQEENIRKYLSSKGQDHRVPKKTQMIQLLSNPMMLTLFAEVQYSDGRPANEGIGEKITTTGELIREFIEHNIARVKSNHHIHQKTFARFHFFIQYLVPYIAYEMVSRNLPEIHEDALEEIINKGYQKFCQPAFLKAFQSQRSHIRLYRKHLRELELRKLSLTEEIERFEKIIDEFSTQELFPLTRENHTLRFLHQSFLDFFAARHLLNEINLSIEKGELPAVLKESILPLPLQRMLGEMTGEHYNIPKLIPKDKSWEEYFLKTSLVQVLDLCRGVFAREKLGNTVWNILSIWKEVRGTFAGADLSELHLSNFNFNGIDCVQTSPDGVTVKSKWDNSRLSSKQWFPQGHQLEVNKVRVSPDGKLLATASKDQSIKLWSAANNQHLCTFHSIHGHHGQVYAIAFSPDSSKVLSGAADHKLIEWSVDTGQCIQVYRGHKDSIRGVAYHPKEKIVASVSNDGTVREWSTVTGKCLVNHDLSDQGAIQCVCFIKEGRSVLVGTQRGPAIELETGTGKKVQTFEQKNVLALADSPCGKKFTALSVHAKPDRWGIQEWSLISGNQTQAFTFDEIPEVNTAAEFVDVSYNSTGRYLLVAGLGDNIYEWGVKASSMVKENVLIQKYTGHARRAASIAYHPNGEHFFSGSYDSAIKKWSASFCLPLHTFPPKVSPYNVVLEIPNSDWLFACSENGTIHRWNIGGDIPVREKIFGGDAPAYGMAFYPGKNPPEKDTRRLVTGGEWGVVQIWTLDGELTRRFIGHEDTVSSLAIDVKTGRVVSADVNGNLILWSLEDEAFTARYPNQKKGAITNVTFSPAPEDNRFATSHENGLLMLWEANTNAPSPIAGPFNHGDAVYTTDFDGQYLLSGGVDGKIKEWHIETKRETVLWESPENKPISFLSYSLDKILVGVEVSNCLYELPIRRKEATSLDVTAIKRFDGHKDYILSAIYGQDGQSIYSVAQDSMLKKWNIKDKEAKWSIKNIPGLKVDGLDFSKVRWTEPLTDEEWEWLTLYGAELEQEKIPIPLAGPAITFSEMPAAFKDREMSK